MGVAATIWKRKTVDERVRILRQFQRELVAATDEITTLVNLDSGKPRQDALSELWVTDIIHRYNKYAPTWLRRRRLSSDLHFMRKAFIETTPTARCCRHRALELSHFVDLYTARGGAAGR